MVLAVPVSSFAAGDVYDTDEPNVTVPIHEEDLNAVEKELVKMVSSDERVIVETFMNLKNGGTAEFNLMSETLFAWAKKWIAE